MIRTVDHTQLGLATALWQLQQAAYALEAALIDYPALPPLQHTPADIQASEVIFLSYQENEQILGALAYTLAGDTLAIESLVVSPQQTRRGIARALLRAVENLPVRKMTVSTAAKNVPAVTLYQTMGYALVQHRTLPDGLVLVHFEKLIESNQ